MAFDNYSKSSGLASANSGTVAHTTTGSNTLMVVSVHTASSNNSVSGITYNGVDFSSAGGFIGGVNGATRRTEFWYLMSPATGTHDVVVTVNGILVAWNFSVATYTGMAQSNALDVSGTAVDASTMTVSLTTTVDNDWIIAGASADGTIGAGANTTQRGTTTAGPDESGIFDTNASQTPAGSHSINVTDSSPSASIGNGGMIAGAFKPAVGTTGFNIAYI